jgi:DNA polymerase (family 10)
MVPVRSISLLDNSEVAEIFEQVADLLEIQGENPFRIRAYRNAARTLRALPESVRAMLEQGRDLAELPGIGEDLAGKIAEVVREGHLELLDELSQHVAPGISGLLALRGLGPRRVRQLHDELGIRSLEDLERALHAGRLERLRGFGAALQKSLQASIGRRHEEGARTPWAEAEPLAQALLEHVRGSPAVQRAEIAGSYRRHKDTVGDLDLLLAAREPGTAIERFLSFPRVARVLAQGTTRAAVVLRSGLQVDLRVVEEQNFGAALVYLTGSKAHNIRLRRLGQERGLKLNEYGLFRGEKRLAGRTEAEVYDALGLPFIEPELREDRGELEAARDHRLPQLVELAELRGDLHLHTSATDGRDTLEVLLTEAARRGYEYVAITDHTSHARIAGGLGPQELEQQLQQVERAAARLPGLHVLKAAEVDILGDGSLDLPGELLDRLQLVVAAVHSGIELPREQQTRRIVHALESGRVDVLAHPAGRLLGQRRGLELDLPRVIAAARAHGCALELNAQPLRLDLDEHACGAAREAGVPVAISSDARSAAELDCVRFGVSQARRGWLERTNVLNTQPWSHFSRWLRRRPPAAQRTRSQP